MRIQIDHLEPFNLDTTLCCGQTFRWVKNDEWWYGVVKDRVLKIRQIGNCLDFENVDLAFVKDYFGLKDNLSEVYSEISKDDHIKKAINVFKGLRILRQDPGECLISYICATYKNISAIKQMISELSRRFGEKLQFENIDYYAFPKPEILAKAATAELNRCGLGYRARYVRQTAKMAYESDLDFEHLKKMTYREAKTVLLSFCGVGLKVADCVSLFSLEKHEAFPVDVWIRRVIIRHYADHFPKEFIAKTSSEKSLSKAEYEKLSLFGQDYFGKYAGYAQEYLYHYEREKSGSPS